LFVFNIFCIIPLQIIDIICSPLKFLQDLFISFFSCTADRTEIFAVKSKKYAAGGKPAAL